MAQVQVEVIDPQALQCRVAGVVHMLARQPLLGGPRVIDRAEHHLARHAPAISRQAQVGEDVAHHPFRLALRVGLGVVEEIDAVVPGRRDQLAGDAAPDLLAEGGPGTEREAGEAKAGAAKAAIVHAGSGGGQAAILGAAGRRSFTMRAPSSGE